MKLDSEEQRQILINALQSATLSGMVSELMPMLEQIARTIVIVKDAEIEKPTLVPAEKSVD